MLENFGLLHDYILFTAAGHLQIHLIMIFCIYMSTAKDIDIGIGFMSFPYQKKVC